MVKTMTRIFKIFICLISALFLFSSCSSNEKSNENCRMIENESYFNEVYVKDHKIYYNTYVTVENTSKNDITVEFIGNLSKEREKERIQEHKIKAVDKNGKSEFKIKAKESVCLELLFIGTLSQGIESDFPLKEDRSLFPIAIKEV